MKLSYLTVIAVLVAGCSITPEAHIHYVGHGGAGVQSDEPINSVQAFEKGLQSVVNGIEMDVQLTADSVLVAYHPEFLQESTLCIGHVNEHTYAELRTCPVSDGSTTQPFVRLDSILPVLGARYPNKDFTLDCKLFAHGDWWDYLNIYVRALNRLDTLVENTLIVECQVDDLLRLVQKNAPNLPIYVYCTDVDAGTRRAATSHYAGITVAIGLLDKEMVRTAHELGLRVTAFDIGSRWSHYNAVNLGVDRIQLDRLPDQNVVQRDQDHLPFISR